MIIRTEKSDDLEAISGVTRAAFKSCPYSQQTEEYIIHALRTAHALTLSLVAEIDHQVKGHIAFSPVTISDGSQDWYGIGPVSVAPECQRQGIGKALIQEGFTQLKALGAKGCILVGDPLYYQRFGFKSYDCLKHPGVPPENFMVLSFCGVIPQGVTEFHPAFSVKKPLT